MPPLEAWEKVLIDAEAYSNDVHAFLNCTDCHGGEAVDDMTAAHAGLVETDPTTNCQTCHPNITPYAMGSLHYTLEGYDTAIYQRSSPEHYETLEYMESYHCSECHASCSDCHISQPRSVGGGLLEGHSYVRVPPMSRTCTACHGSRVKNEYYGLNEGIAGDVHLRQARLACTDCHTGNQMHGIDPAAEDGALDANHRYDGYREPKCETCHQAQIGIGSGIVMHELHGTELISCQVCHSVAYTNCTNCHVDRTAEDVPYYTVEEHSLGFYIGRNPIRNNERPYRYVPVRHVPIDINSFDAYGDDLLPNFLNRPTWAYATPHNIQRNTPQTASCASCHGNDAVFLTPDKVAEGELGGANLNVVVEQAPPLPANLADFMQQLTINQAPASAPATAPQPAAPAAPAEDSGDAGFWGGAEATPEAPATDAGSGDESFWGGTESTPEAPATDAGSGDESFWGGASG